MKNVSVETDIRTQIGLRTEDNEENQPTLLQSNTKLNAIKHESIILNHQFSFFIVAESAPSNKEGNKKIIEVPLG